MADFNFTNGTAIPSAEFADSEPWAYALTMAAATVLTLMAIYVEFFRSGWAGFSAAIQNTLFWVYLLYVVAVLLTVFRSVALSTFLANDQVSRDVFTVAYNWAASLIVCIQCILPMRLLELKRNMYSTVTDNNLILVLRIILVWALLLALTIILYLVGVSLRALILAWRCFFMLNVAVEFYFLFKCSIFAKQGNKSFNARYFWFVKCTIWMRGGIVITLLLRYVGAIERTYYLSLAHMGFVISGMTFYNVKAIKGTVADAAYAAKKGVSVLSRVSSLGTNISSSGDASSSSASARPSPGDAPSSGAQKK